MEKVPVLVTGGAGYIGSHAVLALKDAGWPVAVHAIGDQANRDALDAFAETRDEWAPRRLRRG